MQARIRLRVIGLLGLLVLVAGACGEDGEQVRVQLIRLEVSDVARAAEFYGSVFEWRVSRPDSALAILEATPVAISLSRRDSVRVLIAALVLAVGDLDRTFARVVEHGGIIRAPIGPSWRGREFRFADPDGNELIVWSDAAPPESTGSGSDGAG